MNDNGYNESYLFFYKYSMDELPLFFEYPKGHNLHQLLDSNLAHFHLPTIK